MPLRGVRSLARFVEVGALRGRKGERIVVVINHDNTPCKTVLRGPAARGLREKSGGVPIGPGQAIDMPPNGVKVFVAEG